MKKIMFNDRYGLTQAVLDGRKTQTRRLVPKSIFQSEYDIDDDKRKIWIEDKYGDWHDVRKSIYCFNVGEVVAVAQSYKDCGYNANALDRSPKDLNIVRGTLGESKGWSNKMFVRADACKHRIRITDVRVERLNDISEADCLAEGIEFCHKAQQFYVNYNPTTGSRIWLGATPREAYAALIDKISGKGTFQSNPYVFVYEFELVK